ncbi:glycerol-3-phosphate 1-O-acyltransferase PlsY [Tepidibacillus fermentans]|uniref:Glycerol-3-phosphate acyltransferase n=1 Tax=Tepidibacillus fermentans TaxID=1281767 RepID=A0A4R3K8R7_9BACI|nr:glycerol-3-phosphate 1-O-acyltransferase PlsY [Tepidibacillus fermentans]TCS79414.1 acyl-phosphate glycerol-3-phosphate acyltransferase [Tepidibacillus fermentans]
MKVLFAIFIGYFIGAIPTALIVGRNKNIDIRKHGSGNIGGTNTFRVLGKKAGYFVTIVDILKGIIPTLIGLGVGGEVTGVLAGITASIGHSYSLFAGFKGGKSVATSTGVMLVLNPLSILYGAIVFVIVLFTTKFVSLSSMLAAITVGVTVSFMNVDISVKLAAIFFAVFILYRHRSNIERLLKGTENKAFQKKRPE